MTIELISLDKLRVSTLNVRRTHDKSAMEELKASILAHGLINPLSVKKADDGFHDVIAGGRRLMAHKELEKEGRLPKGQKVACRLSRDQNASEISLAENVVRAAMHPVDEFEAYNGVWAVTEQKTPVSGDAMQSLHR